MRRIETSGNLSGFLDMSLLLDGNTSTCVIVLQKNTKQLQVEVSLPTCPLRQQHQIQVTGDNMRCDEPGFLVVYHTGFVKREGCAVYKPCHFIGSDTSSGQVLCDYHCPVSNDGDIHLLWSKGAWYSDQYTWRVCEITIT